MRDATALVNGRVTGRAAAAGAEGGSKPLTTLITARQRHEQAVFGPLMETGAIKRVGQGCPCLRPQRAIGDKGDSSRHIRHDLRRRGIGVVNPRRRDERCRGSFDHAAYRQRNVAEQLVNKAVSEAIGHADISSTLRT